MKLNSLFKEINKLRNEIKVVVPSGQDPTQLSFQFVEKNQKNLEPGVVVYTFKSSTGKAEADGSLSLRPAWSKDLV